MGDGSLGSFHPANRFEANGPLGTVPLSDDQQRHRIPLSTTVKKGVSAGPAQGRAGGPRLLWRRRVPFMYPLPGVNSTGFPHKQFKRRLICGVLAIVTAIGPMVSMAAAVHDLEHVGREAAQLAADAPHGHLDATIARADDSGAAGDVFHRLSHDGHCCAQGAAIASHSPGPAEASGSCETPPRSISEHRPSTPVRPFRPPIVI